MYFLQKQVIELYFLRTKEITKKKKIFHALFKKEYCSERDHTIPSTLYVIVIATASAYLWRPPI